MAEGYLIHTKYLANSRARMNYNTPFYKSGHRRREFKAGRASSERFEIKVRSSLV